MLDSSPLSIDALKSVMFHKKIHLACKCTLVSSEKKSLFFDKISNLILETLYMENLLIILALLKILTDIVLIAPISIATLDYLNWFGYLPTDFTSENWEA